MLISGIQKFTLLDYPGKVACIVFTPGCNLRCGFCHNPEFVLPDHIVQIKDSFIPEESFFRFLQERSNLLDAVVISGGEPTIAYDLIPFIHKIKAAGFLVKLDTNGNRPDVLKKIINESLVDYIAMDVKSDLDNYQIIAGNTAKPSTIAESIDLIKSCTIPSEFRSTIIKELHTPQILKNMAQLVQGAHRWYLQNFRAARTLNPAYSNYRGFSEAELQTLAFTFKQYATQVAIRY